MLNVAPIWLPQLQQQNYRAVLDAMSRPGRYQTLSIDRGDDDHNEPALIALLASLLDQTVSLADPDKLISQEHMLLLQAQFDQPEQADFILCRGTERPNFQPKLGTLPSPEHSATIVILLEKIARSNEHCELTLQIQGPGIDGIELSGITGLNEQWLSARAQWVSNFPLGVDLILVDDSGLVALPRTSKVEIF